MINNDFTVHDEIYDFLDQHELMELVPQEGFCFVAGVRGRRQLKANAVAFEKYISEHEDLAVAARIKLKARSLRNQPLFNPGDLG